MATIQTVLGPMASDNLGFTLTHEHVWQSAAGVNRTYPDFFDRESVVNRAVSQLVEAREEGVQTIVDVTTMDLGRDILLTEDVARRTGLNIIAATGFWTDIPRIFWDANPDDVPLVQQQHTRAALFVLKRNEVAFVVELVREVFGGAGTVDRLGVIHVPARRGTVAGEQVDRDATCGDA